MNGHQLGAGSEPARGGAGGAHQSGKGFKGQMRRLVRMSLSKLHISGARKHAWRRDCVADVERQHGLEIMTNDRDCARERASRQASGDDAHELAPAPPTPPAAQPPRWARLSAALEAERFDEDELLDGRNVVLERHASTMGYPRSPVCERARSQQAARANRMQRIKRSIGRELTKRLPNLLVSWFQKLRAKRRYRRKTGDLSQQFDELERRLSSQAEMLALNSRALRSQSPQHRTVPHHHYQNNNNNNNREYHHAHQSRRVSSTSSGASYLQASARHVSELSICEEARAKVSADAMPSREQLRQQLHLSFSSSSTSSASSFSSGQRKRSTTNQNNYSQQQQLDHKQHTLGPTAAATTTTTKSSSTTTGSSAASTNDGNEEPASGGRRITASTTDRQKAVIKSKLPRSNVINFAQLVKEDIDQFQAHACALARASQHESASSVGSASSRGGGGGVDDDDARLVGADSDDDQRLDEDDEEMEEEEDELVSVSPVSFITGSPVGSRTTSGSRLSGSSNSSTSGGSSSTSSTSSLSGPEFVSDRRKRARAGDRRQQHRESAILRSQMLRSMAACSHTRSASGEIASGAAAGAADFDLSAPPDASGGELVARSQNSIATGACTSSSAAARRSIPDSSAATELVDSALLARQQQFYSGMGSAVPRSTTYNAGFTHTEIQRHIVDDDQRTQNQRQHHHHHHQQSSRLELSHPDGLNAPV